MFKHGKFTHPGAVKSAGEKPPMDKGKEQGREQGREQGGKNEPQAAHGDGPVEHVTKSHPGQTQPHPTTGVHAFHGHHTGGGKYKSYTHHDGGEVEERDHASAGDMHQAGNEALPDEGSQMGNEGGMDDFSGALSGVGGESVE